MDEPPGTEDRWTELRRRARDSLFILTGVYDVVGEALVFRGERPGAGWHAHGYTSKKLVLLADGQPRRWSIRKQRWLRYGTTETVHSRPPDDPALVRSCTLVIVLALWSWLDGERGIHRREEILPALSGLVSTRTVQRWMARALNDALDIEQTIRLAVIDKCEPRPIDNLFRGGLSPPPSLVRRHRRNPLPASTLWRAFAILTRSALHFDLSISPLLAEARGRWTGARAPRTI